MDGKSGQRYRSQTQRGAVMKVGDMNFEQVWLGKAVRPAPGDEGVVFELLGRTRAGGYYRMTLPLLPEEKPHREFISLCLLEYWFREHGYDLPGWIQDEIQDEGWVFCEAGWDQGFEERRVVRAREEWAERQRVREGLLRENELLKLEIEFLKMLGSKW